MKINTADMHAFVLNYDHGWHTHQRFGQAFCNHFEISSNQSLFYEENRSAAEAVAWELVEYRAI